jgi:hypothetical protein
MTKEITLVIIQTIIVTFFAHAQLIPNLGADRSICEGDSVILDAGLGKDHYLWNNGATTQSIYVKQAGNYFVKVDSAGISGQSTSVKINILAKPTISVVDTLQICQGQNTNIIANVIGSNLSIQWVGFVNPRADVLSTNFSASTIPGTYTVTVTASSSQYCSTKAVTQIIVHENPVSVITVNYPFVPKGGQVDLKGSSIMGKGVPPYTGKWIPEEFILSEKAGTNGFEAHSLSLINKITSFALISTDKNGCKDTVWTMVNTNSGIDFKTVGDKSNKFFNPDNLVDTSTYPSNSLNYKGIADICEGDDYTLLTNITTPGSGDYSYTWTDNNSSFTTSKANIKVTPATSSSYTIYSFELKDNIYPTAIIEKQYFRINVHKNPITTIVSNRIDSIFELEQVELSGISTFFNGATKNSSLWTGNNISSINKAYTTFKPISKGDYTFDYTITDNFGCIATATSIITVYEKDTIKLKSSNYKLNKTISLSPNPTSQFLHIKSDWIGKSKIKIYNIIGVLVFEKQLLSSNEIDEFVSVANYPVGIYSVVVETSNGVKAESVTIKH